MIGGKSIGHQLGNITKDIYNLVFPDLCPGCDRAERWKDEIFCLSCTLRAPYIADGEERQALEGKDHFPPNSGGTHSLFYYQRSGMVRRVLQKIKYQNKRQLAKRLGYFLGQKLGKRENTLIVPVPLHPSRLKKRGYNQAKCIAQGLSVATNIPVEELLKRTVQSVSMTTLGKKQRQELTSQSYFIRKQPGPDIHSIVIVDDVITTGATLNACTKAIQQIWDGDMEYASVAITV